MALKNRKRLEKNNAAQQNLACKETKSKNKQKLKHGDYTNKIGRVTRNCGVLDGDLARHDVDALGRKSGPSEGRPSAVRRCAASEIVCIERRPRSAHSETDRRVVGGRCVERKRLLSSLVRLAPPLYLVALFALPRHEAANHYDEEADGDAQQNAEHNRPDVKSERHAELLLSKADRAPIAAFVQNAWHAIFGVDFSVAIEWAQTANK